MAAIRLLLARLDRALQARHARTTRRYLERHPHP